MLEWMEPTGPDTERRIDEVLRATLEDRNQPYGEAFTV